MTRAERADAGLYRRLRECSVCRGALHELSRWLQALDHCDPVVGPEFATRHDFFNQGLTEHPRIASGVARLEARLLKDLGCHDEALELLERAVAGYEERDDESRTLLHWMHEACGERIEGEEIADGTTQDQTG